MASSAAAQTVDDILARNASAKGGLARMKAVATLRATGRVTIGPGMEAPITIEQKRPNKVRIEVTVQGLSMIQAYDGVAGWMLDQINGRNEAEPMPAEIMKNIDEQADMDGPLVDYQAKGSTVELVGKEKVRGADCYKVKVSFKSGDIRIFYIDAGTYLETKVDARTTLRGTEVEGDTLIGDWRDVSGMMMRFSIDSGQTGAPARQRISLDKIEINPPIDDARFKMPLVRK
jgi:hypothetical protein